MHLSQPLRHPLHHPQTSVHHSSPPSLFDTCPPHRSNNDKCHRFDLVRISSHCLANYSILFASFSASIQAPICRIWFSGCGDIDILVFEADGILIRPYLLIRGTSSLHSFIIGKAFSSLSTVPNIVPIWHHIARQSLHHRTTPYIHILTPPTTLCLWYWVYSSIIFTLTSTSNPPSLSSLTTSLSSTQQHPTPSQHSTILKTLVLLGTRGMEDIAWDSTHHRAWESPVRLGLSKRFSIAYHVCHRANLDNTFELFLSGVSDWGQSLFQVGMRMIGLCMGWVCILTWYFDL